MLIDRGVYTGNGGTKALVLPWTPDVFMAQEHGSSAGGFPDLVWTATGLPGIFVGGEGFNPSSASGVITLGVNSVSILQEATLHLNKNTRTYAYLALKSENDIDFGSYVGNQTARDIALAINNVPAFFWTTRGGTPSNFERCWVRMEGLTFLDSIGGCFPLTAQIKDSGEIWADQITDLGTGQFSLGAVTGSNTTGATYYYLALFPNGKLNYGEQAVLTTDVITIDTSLTLQCLFAFVFTPGPPTALQWETGGGIWRIDSAMPNEPSPLNWDRQIVGGGGLQIITGFPGTSFVYNAPNDSLPSDGYVWWLGLGMPGGGSYGGWF